MQYYILRKNFIQKMFNHILNFGKAMGGNKNE